VQALEPPLHPVRRLVLRRHGRTEWNASGRFQGQLDPPLDAEGRRQAALVAPLLAAELPAADTVVVSSDLSRASETATALTALLGLPLRTDARLREHGLGCWEGLTRTEVAERYPDQYADWLSGRPIHGRGGETPQDVAARALAALADLPPAEVGVVVSHGGTSGRVLEQLLRLGPDHRRVFGPLANGAWSELVFQTTGWRLIRHNSALPRLVDGGPAAPRSTGTPEEGPPPAEQDADAAL
jgi:probable phosphoglycerate mutase